MWKQAKLILANCQYVSGSIIILKVLQYNLQVFLEKLIEIFSGLNNNKLSALCAIFSTPFSTVKDRATLEDFHTL